MKHYTSMGIYVLLFLFTFNFSFAQERDWFLDMQDPNVNFREVQKDFNEYWKDRTDYKGNGWKIFKRWEYNNSTSVRPDGHLPSIEHIMNEYYRYTKNAAVTRSASGSWSIIGPVSYPNNNTTQPTGLGRVNVIQFHPTDANTIFLGTPNGGIWKSTNGGTTWNDLSANIPSLGVSSILVHPTTPNIIYIGTGDRDAGDNAGIGVWKTTDGGITWNAANSTMGNTIVGEMVMNSNDPNIILAATEEGIYKTINGGTSWTLKIAGKFKDIKLKPTDPTIVYATKMGSTSGSTSALFYRSTDTGNTWTNIGSADGVPSSGARMVIGVSPNDPDYVYLLQIRSTTKKFSRLLRSTNSGASFSTRSDYTTVSNIFDYECDGSGSASQATYDLCITVDPTDVDNVYVGSINNWKSTNGGQSWTIISHWVGNNLSNSPKNSCAPSVHADQHYYKWSPHNGNLYLGNDGGIYHTANGGTSWTQITNNLPISQIYKLGQSATNPDYNIIGCQDNGTSSTINSASFTTIGGGDGAEAAIDYTDPNYSYSSSIEGKIKRSTTGPLGGTSEITKSGNGINEVGAWVTPFFIHKTTPTTMFAGYRNVWRCTNLKTALSTDVTWSKISSGGVGTCTSLEQSDADPDIIYVVRDNTSLKRTDNANASASSVTWTNCTLPGGVDVPIADIKTHPTDSDIVYAASLNKVYKSIDKGMTWADITGNLPDLDVKCLILDKNANEGIYIGNKTSVWYKDANSPDWALFSTGLPPVTIKELEIYYDAGNPANNKIKAATFGRGLWQSDLMGANGVGVSNPSGVSATPVTTTQINLAWTKNSASNEVIIATSATSTFGTPASGTAYNVNDVLPAGGGTIIYKGSLSAFSHVGLTSNTTYYYKLWSVNGSDAYSSGTSVMSATTLVSYDWTGNDGDNDWFNPANWASNSVPTATDNVYIPASAGIQPHISGGNAECKNLYIESGATLSMSGSTNYTLAVGGNWTNDGTFTHGIGTVNFNGTDALQTISGTATTNFYKIEVDKVAQTNVLEVQSLISLNSASDALTLTNGVFKLSSASTITPFSSNPNIGSTAGFWNNGGTVNGGNFEWNLAGGLLKLSAGTINIGTSTDNHLRCSSGSTVIVEAGTMNIAGALRPNSGTSSYAYTQSGGTVNVNLSGSTSTSRGALEFPPTSTFTMSGGSIIVVNKSSNADADIIIDSDVNNVTGGLIQVGNAATPLNETFYIYASTPLYNLTINATNNPSLIQLGTSVVQKDLTIGGTLDLNDLDILVGGNWSNSGTFTPGVGYVRFNGTTNQHIGGANATTFYGMEVDNTEGVTLVEGVSPTIDNQLIFYYGLINTGSNMMIIANNAVVTGAGSSEYINGKCRKVGNDAFVFPVGNQGQYAPIGMSAPSNSADHFTAEYFYASPDASYEVDSIEAPLERVSSSEYWMLNRTGGTSNVAVTLSWDERSGAVNSVANLLVARWNGTKWVSHGNASTTGNNSAGTITSSAISNFSPFTLGTDDNGVNGFPVEFSAFEAKAKEYRKVYIDWATEREINNDYFVVERSINASNWETVEKVKGAGNSDKLINYQVIDKMPYQGTSYYRLKTLDINGLVNYSDIKTIKVDEETLMFPNPTNGMLNIWTSETDYEVKIYDMLGKVVFTEKNAAKINISHLPSGRYAVAILKNNLVKQQSFIYKL